MTGSESIILALRSDLKNGPGPADNPREIKVWLTALGLALLENMKARPQTLPAGLETFVRVSIQKDDLFGYCDRDIVDQEVSDTHHILIGSLDTVNEDNLQSQAHEPTITYDSLGKPHLLVKGRPCASISFTGNKKEQWVAIGPLGLSLGVDIAGPDEFGPDYPLGRVFSPDELILLGKVSTLSRSWAAALIWSAKEALVKAVGCGFHTLDFRDVQILNINNCGPYFKGSAQIRSTKRPQQKYQRSARFLSLSFHDSWLTICVPPPKGSARVNLD